MWNHGWTGPEPSSPPEPGRAVDRDAPGGGLARLVGAGALALCCAVGIGVIVKLAGRTGDGLTAPELAAAAVDTAPSGRSRGASFGLPAPRGAALTLASRRAPVAADGPAGVELDGVPFVPFHQKRGEYLGSVRLGRWPAERQWVRDPAYANPRGFLVVNAATRSHRVSPHFTLGEFAMRDGAGGVSYLVLREALVEKLEAVIAELEAGGVSGADLRILSGFRAPHHNAGVEGAAPSSRHQFGDAADVIVDADGDGRMDDLNRDGRVDRADVLLVAEVVERVERRRPDLVGGLGLYEAQGPSGPFLHIDVRGTSSRWGTALRGAAASPPASARARRDAPPGRRVVKTASCRAEGEFAEILCGKRGE